MDAETQQVAEKLARFVADGGPEVEALAAERNRDNPAFRSVAVYVTLFLIFTLFLCHLPHTKYLLSFFSFLYDQQSPAFRFYKEKVQECRAAASQSSSPPAAESGRDLHRPAAAPLLGIPPPVNHAPPPHIQEGETPPVKRKRKSRWGSEDDKVELPIPPIVIPQELTVPDPNTPSLSGTKLLTLLSFLNHILICHFGHTVSWSNDESMNIKGWWWCLFQLRSSEVSAIRRGSLMDW